MATSTTKKEANNNLIIVMVLITFLVVGASVILVKDLVSGIALNNRVLTAKNAAYNTLQSDLNAAPSLVSSYQSLGSDVPILADALPTTVDYPSLIVMLENIENDSGTQLKSVAPVENGLGGGTSSTATSATASTSALSSAKSSTSAATTISNPTPQSFPFSISVQGTYAGLLQYLTDLQLSVRPMVINGLQISGSGSSMTAEISALTYYQDQAQLPFGTETVK